MIAEFTDYGCTGTVVYHEKCDPSSVFDINDKELIHIVESSIERKNNLKMRISLAKTKAKGKKNRKKNKRARLSRRKNR